MTPAEYLPGVHPRRRGRNAAVSLAYLLTLPVVVPLTAISALMFGIYVVLMAGRDRHSVGDRCSDTSGTVLHPGIGRAAMLAVTVVVASALGAFVFEFADTPADAPQAGFSFERTPLGKLAMTHVAGDRLDQQPFRFASMARLPLDRGVRPR